MKKRITIKTGRKKPSISIAKRGKKRPKAPKKIVY